MTEGRESRGKKETCWGKMKAITGAEKGRGGRSSTNFTTACRTPEKKKALRDSTERRPDHNSRGRFGFKNFVGKTPRV